MRPAGLPALCVLPAAARLRLLGTWVLQDKPRSDHGYSVVRRRKYRDASGAATARISADQASAASMGCCIGQALIDADGFGLSQSWRAPAVTALTGFQSAAACSQPGMCWVGTIALDTNASGNSTMNPNEAADSGLLLLSPTHAATHDNE